MNEYIKRSALICVQRHSAEDVRCALEDALRADIWFVSGRVRKEATGGDVNYNYVLYYRPKGCMKIVQAQKINNSLGQFYTAFKDSC